MNTLAFETSRPTAERVKISSDTLQVDLSDGRSIAVPLSWYPRLLHGTPDARRNWRLIGRGTGIHWEDLDEDVSVEGLLAGQPSGESQMSFKRWLESRSSAGRPLARSTRTTRKAVMK